MQFFFHAIFLQLFPHSVKSPWPANLSAFKTTKANQAIFSQSVDIHN